MCPWHKPGVPLPRSGKLRIRCRGNGLSTTPPLPLRAVVRGAPGATCRRTGLLPYTRTRSPRRIGQLHITSDPHSPTLAACPHSCVPPLVYPDTSTRLPSVLSDAYRHVPRSCMPILHTTSEPRSPPLSLSSTLHPPLSPPSPTFPPPPPPPSTLPFHTLSTTTYLPTRSNL